MGTLRQSRSSSTSSQPSSSAVSWSLRRMERSGSRTDFSAQPDGTEAKTCFHSTGELLLNPLVEHGCAEAPDLANLQGTNQSAPRQLLVKDGI